LGGIFVGCCIGADLTKLGKDFGMEQWAKLISIVQIGMFARQRDVVQDARIRLEHLVDVVLNEKLDKSAEVRCSRWSIPKFSDRQIQYKSWKSLGLLLLFYYYHPVP
jgi:ribonuclease D